MFRPFSTKVQFSMATEAQEKLIYVFDISVDPQSQVVDYCVINSANRVKQIMLRIGFFFHMSELEQNHHENFIFSLPVMISQPV